MVKTTVFALLLFSILFADGNRVVDRLLKAADNVKGEDLCAGCDEVYCNEQPACGYVQVKNGGGYVGKICVNGLNNQTNTDFCCTSGNYDVGQTAEIKLPCNAEKVSLTAEEDIFINSWSVV